MDSSTDDRPDKETLPRGVSHTGRFQSDVEREAALPLCFSLSTRKVHFRKESVSVCAVMRHFIPHRSAVRPENVTGPATNSASYCPARCLTSRQKRASVRGPMRPLCTTETVSPSYRWGYARARNCDLCKLAKNVSARELIGKEVPRGHGRVRFKRARPWSCARSLRVRHRRPASLG
jgi:hypothetical protein